MLLLFNVQSFGKRLEKNYVLIDFCRWGGGKDSGSGAL